MPNWRKVLVSGSDAQLNSVYVPGPAINQLTASVAITALNTYNSTALNSGTVQRIDSASTTWNVQHNLNEFWPIVYIWEENPDYVYTPVVTDQIEIISQNQIRITFPSAKRGYVNVSRAGHIVSGSVPWTNLIGDANVTASLNIYGNVVASGGFTGSLIGTSSWANNSISSSYSNTASVALSASWVASASVSVSSSYALTASYYSGSVLSASLAASSSYPLSVSGSTVFSRVSNLTGFNTTASIIIGNGSGISSTNASHSIFLGTSAGTSATNAHGSVFLGRNSGLQATNARNSNFLGVFSGYQASSAYFSNFLGNEVGYQATNAYYANFLGYRAGYRATNASTALFVGQESGLGATNAISSIFLGTQSGYSASQAQASNFIGESSGYQAISATLSNFIGSQAGYQASNASLSTLIGYHTGKLVSGNGIGSNNIIIGTNITLENDRSDSINLGSILFATGAYSNQITNPYSGSVDGRVGINVVNPQYALDVSGSTNISGDLIVTGSIFGSIASASYALTASYVNTLTQNVILTGSISMSGSISAVNYLDFNTTASAPTRRSGRVYWNNTDGCLDVFNNEADITLQVGQENWTRVFNDLGTTITNGTVVRLNGSHGDVPTVERAQALAVSGSVNVLNQILGLATHDIEAGSFGYITTQGLVRGLNTNAFNDGDVLFVGTGSAGVLQNVAPRAPYEIIPVGVCIKASPGGSGIVYVAVQEPLDFSDLSSVLVDGIYSYGDIWVYRPSGSLGVWEHTKQLSGSYDITGSLRVSGSISASLFGTASQAISSSWAISSSRAISSSFSENAVSSSYPITVTGSTLRSVLPSAGIAASTVDSVFFGTLAGNSATNALQSNFLGNRAGGFATNASDSNFLGWRAGFFSTNADNSNFLGNSAGGSTNAQHSNFLGYQAGLSATDAKYSNFLGYQAGNGATNASHSLLVGYNVGINSPGPNNIIIGTNISVASGRSNSINLGGIIFASGAYSNANSTLYSGSANGRVGINVVNPQFALDVSGSVNITGNIIASSITGSIASSSYAFTASSAVSSSYAYTASSAISSSWAVSSSRSISSLSSSYAFTASSATSSSFALTSSFVNTLNQNVVISNALAIGTSSLGSTENTLVVGLPSAGGAGKGGQILLQASGGLYTSASMIDNYQNRFRILRGTNASSDAEYFNVSLHTGQVGFSKYTGSGVFSGTAVANLAVDSGGNVITTSPGGSSTSVTFNRVTASYTFVLSDAGKTIEVSGSTNTTYNLTIPASSTTDFADGTFIDVILYGTGSIQFLSGSGVTVRSANNWTKMGTRYGAATIVNISGNEWYLIGNVNA